jgi:transposase
VQLVPLDAEGMGGTLDVWPYLTDLLRRIASIVPNDTAPLEAPLPDRWLAAHPEHRLEQREEESRKAQAR